jgi:hypothetical protein
MHDMDRLPLIHEDMSQTDCYHAGFPEFNDDTGFAELSEEFAAAVQEVEVLLCGDLRTPWLKLARDLRVDSRGQEVEPEAA